MAITSCLHGSQGFISYGAPGVGKSESIKDLSKSFAVLYFQFDCERLDQVILDRILTGMCKLGAWGCFDQPSLLNQELLSIMAY